ncbi:MAG: hypothetical protein CMH61_01200 [Nanoarchaeota archaeon]|nr:hypothetical protein [Nanoarchaeota archaeon]
MKRGLLLIVFIILAVSVIAPPPPPPPTPGGFGGSSDTTTTKQTAPTSTPPSFDDEEDFEFEEEEMDIPVGTINERVAVLESKVKDLQSPSLLVLALLAVNLVLGAAVVYLMFKKPPQV